MHTGLDELKQVFQVELAQKQKSLSAAQAQLKEATWELSNRRQTVAATQKQVAQREEYRHSIANLKRIIAILQEGILPANENFIQQNLEALQVDSHSPTTELIRLRWLNLWMGKSCQALENRIANIAEESKKKEAQCRKVVAMCCGVEEERVAEILDDLVIAIESDGAGMDLTRVAGFLSKVST